MKVASTLLQYRKHFRDLPINRITLVMALGFCFMFVIFARLFYLQVVKANYYQQVALEKNQGYTEIPARRGEILIQDSNSEEPYALATNATFKLVFADPTLIDDPVYVGEKLAPLLFDLEDEQERDEERYENLLDKYKKEAGITTTEAYTGTEGAAAAPVTDTTTTPDATAEEEAEPASETPVDFTVSYDDLRLHSDDELYALFKEELIDTLEQKTRSVVLYIENLEPDLAAAISAARLTGVEITEKGSLYFYPPQISDKEKVAKELAEILNADKADIEDALIGKNRFVILKRKLAHEISDEIEKLMEEEEKEFFGIRLREEYYRYYPESNLGAQLLGYVSSWGEGQYGIESAFDAVLQGQSGYFTSSIDGGGKQITVGETEFQDAVNGSDVMLTIDRAIQAKVEEELAKGVNDSDADSGIVIVQDPSTGKILAMAHYPTFDPNSYSEVYETEKIDLTPDQIENLYRVGEAENERIYLYIRKDPDVRIELFYNPDNDSYYKYKNEVGPEVYQLKAVQLPYEPGSVFKPIAMAAAIDAGEVTPYTTFYSNGPVEVDEYFIKTFNNSYYGLSTMTEVLIHSDNTGMVFVAFKLGRALFYDYLQAFGFGQKTRIEFEGENEGTVEYYDYWADSELVTKAFGQGITVTPIQLITAISALANGGLLMQPYIVDYVEDADGKRQVYEPEVVRRVVTEKTSDEVTAMMTAVVENSAPRAQLPTHYIAGKTGTAQTYKHGIALSGVGTTIVSFIGFAPISDPKFTILVKMDRPKNSEWAEANAGPVFHNIAEFLVNYYNIPPDKNL